MSEVRKWNWPLIDKVCVINAAHIPFEDSRLLNEAEPPLVTARFPYGWIVPVNEEAIEGSFLSPAFSRLIQYAKGQGCSWVRLDTDGPTIEGLPTYEWGPFNVQFALLKLIYRASLAKGPGLEKALEQIRVMAFNGMGALGYNSSDIGVCPSCGEEGKCKCS